MPSERLSIFATGPAGYAGAGRIMCNALDALAQAGHYTVYVGLQTPLPFVSRLDRSTRVRLIEPVRSAAIGEGAAVPHGDALLPFELGERLVDAVITCPHSASSDSVIWAHYLYPYALAGILAASQLRRRKHEVQLWITPAGSDVWEIGPQLPVITEGILTSAEVDRVLTYSSAFAAEIQQASVSDILVDTFTPCLSSDFRPCSSHLKAALRRLLGVPQDALVISAHSNMRPVKAPNDILHIARRLSALLFPRPVSLVMCGPTGVQFDSQASDLQFLRLGVLRDVRSVLWAADVELNASRHDSFNLSLAEAMACGLPVVTTDVVGILSHISSAGAGFAVPLEDPQGNARTYYSSAVAHLMRLACNEGLRKALARRAARYAAIEFSAAQLVDGIVPYLNARIGTTGP
jgi:glycosyltransferase involved in cell wall biosynthesis